MRDQAAGSWLRAISSRFPAAGLAVLGVAAGHHFFGMVSHTTRLLPDSVTKNVYGGVSGF